MDNRMLPNKKIAVLKNQLSGSATHNSQRKWLFQGDRSGQQTQKGKARYTTTIVNKRRKH